MPFHDQACPVPSDHEDLLGAALGIDAADGLAAVGLEGWSNPTPYLGIEALSVIALGCT